MTFFPVGAVEVAARCSVLLRGRTWRVLPRRGFCGAAYSKSSEHLPKKNPSNSGGSGSCSFAPIDPSADRVRGARRTMILTHCTWPHGSRAAPRSPWHEWVCFRERAPGRTQLGSVSIAGVAWKGASTTRRRMPIASRQPVFASFGEIVEHVFASIDGERSGRSPSCRSREAQRRLRRSTQYLGQVSQQETRGDVI